MHNALCCPNLVSEIGVRVRCGSFSAHLKYTHAQYVHKADARDAFHDSISKQTFFKANVVIVAMTSIRLICLYMINLLHSRQSAIFLLFLLPSEATTNAKALADISEKLRFYLHKFAQLMVDNGVHYVLLVVLVDRFQIVPNPWHFMLNHR